MTQMLLLVFFLVLCVASGPAGLALVLPHGVSPGIICIALACAAVSL